MRLTANKIAGKLRQHGYRLTTQRRAILKAIAGSHDHLNSREIYEKVKVQNRNIGLVTIYRTLDLLIKLKLICRIHTGGASQSYLMRRPAGHHHHLVCSKCGQAVDFTYCNLSNLEQRLSLETGYKIEGHLLEMYGRCPACLGIV